MSLNNPKKSLKKLGWIQLEDLGKFLKTNSKKKVKVPSPPKSMKADVIGNEWPAKEKAATAKWAKTQNEKEKGLLKKAFRDLDEELKRLQADKTQLENRETEVGAKINKIQTEEINLRNRISELMHEEAEQEKKKSKLGEQISKVDKKMEKVYSIRRRLEEV